MGVNLIINNADFSSVALPSVEPTPTEVVVDVELFNGLYSSSGARQRCSTAETDPGNTNVPKYCTMYPIPIEQGMSVEIAEGYQVRIMAITNLDYTIATGGSRAYLGARGAETKTTNIANLYDEVKALKPDAEYFALNYSKTPTSSISPEVAKANIVIKKIVVI